MNGLCRAAALLLCVLCILPAAGLAGKNDNGPLYDERLAALQMPCEQDEASGTLTLRTGDIAWTPCLHVPVIPYDEPTEVSAGGYVFSSDNESVITVYPNGLITAVAPGTATLTCTGPDGEHSYAVTVSDDAMPQTVRNYVYVLNREYFSVKRETLKKYNTYAKWYYGKKKEVGWCSVFTIYCANAAGNPVYRYKESNATNRFPALNYDDVPEVMYMAEGEVGHQYDAFFKVGRFGSVPKPGYLVIYADLKKAYRTTHIASVVDVEERGGGVYAVTTVEGNMSNTVKRYCYLYDSNAANNQVTDKKTKLQKNMSELPAEEQTDPLVQYQLHTDHWAVFGFCETW